jgi:hypothetical protein|tara:strand:- start:1638 stop:1805 length:168 start_codon:yes stop_codon:yes gene_type:complete
MRVKTERIAPIILNFSIALSIGEAIEIKVAKMTRIAYPYVKRTEKLNSSFPLKKS